MKKTLNVTFCSGNKIRFKYYWHHIPTGKTGESEQEFHNYRDFLEKLNTWNRIGNGDWMYFC
jgi:hypothetical protein